MATSILTSVKKVLGIAENYEEFDVDVLMHINTVFSTLAQLGIGPESGYRIDDKSATWEDYLANDNHLNNVKTYVFLRVRLLFDPPETSFAIEAMRKQVEEFEWRINVYREGRDHPWPTPTTS